MQRTRSSPWGIRELLTRRPLGRWTLAIGLAVSIALSITLGGELPKPPDGFSWQSLPELKGAILRPSGWSFLPEVSDDEIKFSEVEPGTGERATFSISMMRGSGPRSDAVKLADDFITGLSTALQAEKTWGDTAGPFIMRAGIFRERANKPDAHRMYSQMLVNPKTGTVFVVGFEASVRDWDEKWKVGQVVCRLMLLDDEL